MRGVGEYPGRPEVGGVKRDTKRPRGHCSEGLWVMY